MKDILKIENIEIKENKIIINFSKNEKWCNFIYNENFFIEYNCSIENVPKSIAIIPFICDLLPIIWINDLYIELDEIDETFYNCIDNIKKGYMGMYPDIDFNHGGLLYKKIIKNTFERKNKAVMFSGGIDAFNTLFSHMDEKPDLITIFGADISLDDNEGIYNVKKRHKEISEQFGLNFFEIYSNFKTIINYTNVNNTVKNINTKYEWWHEFQHGIALLGLSAPLAYLNNYSIVYIASSFTAKDIGNYTCASDPTIDNYYCHSSSITIHDGYEFSRQAKIHNIVNFLKEKNEKVDIRVCWESNGGNNCCECEKCYRTILGILATGGDPLDYGFYNYVKTKKKMIKYLKKNLKYEAWFKLRYPQIQEDMKKLNEVDKDFKWFVNYKIGRVKSLKMNYFKNILEKIKFSSK